jgi:hypothetical protein
VDTGLVHQARERTPPRTSSVSAPSKTQRHGHHSVPARAGALRARCRNCRAGLVPEPLEIRAVKLEPAWTRMGVREAASQGKR